jgi:hypothetical protein
VCVWHYIDIIPPNCKKKSNLHNVRLDLYGSDCYTVLDIVSNCVEYRHNQQTQETSICNLPSIYGFQCRSMSPTTLLCHRSRNARCRCTSGSSAAIWAAGRHPLVQGAVPLVRSERTVAGHEKEAGERREVGGYEQRWWMMQGGQSLTRPPVGGDNNGDHHGVTSCTMVGPSREERRRRAGDDSGR